MRRNSSTPPVFLTAEEIDHILLNGHEEAILLNSSRTSEFVMNNRGQRLHIRSHWPATTPKAFVIYCHAYILHSNRPTDQYMERVFAEQGFGTVCIDFHGHGYSEGRKGLFSNPHDLYDDVLCVLLALYSSNNESAEHCVLRTLSGIPFFLLGHSTGGGASLIVSNILSLDHDAKNQTGFSKSRMDTLVASVCPYFKGAIALAPMVILPNVVKRVVNSVGAIFPRMTLPTIFRSDSNIRAMMWSSPKFGRYVMSDRYPHVSHGLTYWGGSRISSLRTLTQLCEQVRQAIEQCAFPFLILHDAKDSFVKIDGSYELFDKAPSADKQLILIPGGLHDPMTNRVDFVCKLCLDWMQSHL